MNRTEVATELGDFLKAEKEFHRRIDQLSAAINEAHKKLEDYQEAASRLATALQKPILITNSSVNEDHPTKRLLRAENSPYSGYRYKLVADVLGSIELAISAEWIDVVNLAES